MSEEETLGRLGCFWRNCVRVLHFLGDDVEADGFGQTPSYRRMNDKRSLRPGGKDAPPAKEPTEDARNRFAITLLASSRPPLRGPATSRPKDISGCIPKNIT